MDLPAQSDVVIVGAGFAGCATSWALAARGVQALVLEREAELGRFASGRGAGLGRQLAEDDLTSAHAVRGAAILRSRFPGAWTPCGGVLAFDDPSAAQHYVARARRLGVAHEVLERGGVLARWPELTGLPIAAALYVPGDGVIGIRALLDQLAAGLDIRRSVAVTAIAERGATCVVETSAGAIEARVVVDATGAWAGRLTDDPPLDVYKRHLFILEAAPTKDAPYLWYLGRDEMYLRADGDNILISPCDSETVEPGHQINDDRGEDALRTRLAIAAPRLHDAAIARRWACQRAFTPDRTMRLGRDPRRAWLVWAAALGGHGATAATAVGETVAEAVVSALHR